MIALAFDEMLGIANIAAGHPGMTARLIVHYRQPTPLFRELRFRAVGRPGRGPPHHVAGRALRRRDAHRRGRRPLRAAPARAGRSRSSAPTPPDMTARTAEPASTARRVGALDAGSGAGGSSRRGGLPIPRASESMPGLWLHRARRLDRVPAVRHAGRRADPGRRRSPAVRTPAPTAAATSRAGARATASVGSAPGHADARAAPAPRDRIRRARRRAAPRRRAARHRPRHDAPARRAVIIAPRPGTAFARQRSHARDRGDRRDLRRRRRVLAHPARQQHAEAATPVILAPQAPFAGIPTSLSAIVRIEAESSRHTALVDRDLGRGPERRAGHRSRNSTSLATRLPVGARPISRRPRTR